MARRYERSQVVDIAVPGMPAGSLGMEFPGRIIDESSLNLAERRNAMTLRSTLFAFALASVVGAGLSSVWAQQNQMSFFITSMGAGNGANLGGIAGADAHCQKLASAVGAGNRTWHAYLSMPATNGQPAVNARDRIGSGPWYNAKGVMVARNVADLHGDNNQLGKENSLTEKGGVVPGRGDTPNQHDMITGSQLDGTAFPPGNDTTCNGYTSGDAGSVQLGHFDKQGGGANPNSWNSAHPSKGCSQQNLIATGGNGYFYCFATN